MHTTIVKNRENAFKAALTAGIFSMIFATAEPLIIIIYGYSSIISVDAIHSFLDAIMSFATALSIHIALKKDFLLNFLGDFIKLKT